MESKYIFQCLLITAVVWQCPHVLIGDGICFNMWRKRHAAAPVSHDDVNMFVTCQVDTAFAVCTVPV